ncbi:nucleotidyltransferase domain-containing protein [Ornithinibacillus sp. 179-J 7C1 HS]|uniref:nucleotidyltransferase domain-containing protein n=1 Tax=Ornithinibacillus sp. 179-J 7C1 HS TaxID=3142384 RepID=UPI0039A09F65
MTYEELDTLTKSQLNVLKEIIAVSEAAEVDFWLRGGWAIDFLLGKITRPHDDIDVVTWIQNREQLENKLIKIGYERTFVKEEFRDRQSDFCKGDVEITFSYITLKEDENLILNGLPEWVWRPDSLLHKTFMLNGVSARVLHPTQLLEEKEVYEQIGRVPRQKDANSKKVLQRVIEEGLY